MRVVELDRYLVAERAEVAVLLQVPAHDVLQRADEKKNSCLSRNSCPAGVESAG